MVTPEMVTGPAPESTFSTLFPLPCKMTVLPGVVGWSVTAVVTLKGAPWAGWYVPAARSIVSPLVAIDSASVSEHGEPEVHCVPEPPTAAYSVPMTV
jgi:hypothetical protein